MSNIVELYRDIMYNKHDPRTNDWFLVASPGSIVMIVVSYIYFCKSAGPKYMRDKKPLDLRNVMILYNFIQVLFSIYLFYEGFMSGWLNGYSLTCQAVDESDNPQAMRMARIVHFYFVCKLIELLDTVFFVLRKKNRQITFLHVYHHALMPLCAWIGVRYFPGGHATFLGWINSLIHVIMYTYYMLSSFGPEIQKYLWWKKYLTSLQLVQFGLVFAHSFQLFFNGCTAIPKPLVFLLCLNSGIFIYLFGSFYVKNYIQTVRRKGGDTANVYSKITVNNDTRKAE